MKLSVKVLVVIAAVICSCTSNTTPSARKKAEGCQDVQSKETRNTVDEPFILIYGYGDFPNSIVSELQGKLSYVFGTVEYKGQVDFPTEAWYEPRQRYRAPKLLDYQKTLFTCKSSERGKSEYILGVTSKDISLKYKEHDDWGVMGLSYLKQGVSVISTFRLGGVHKMNKDSFYKLALHELGHAVGLPHCEKSNICIMRDAKGKDHFPQLTDFCPSCKAYLQEHGWNLQ